MFFPSQKQEVSDDLGVYVLELLTEVSTLPSLVATSLVKKEMFFQFFTWPHVGHMIKG